MMHLLLVLYIFVLCIIKSYCPETAFESNTLCYEHINIPGIEMALNWNSKQSAAPYYIHLKIRTEVEISRSWVDDTFFYHMKLARRTCTHSMEFIRYHSGITAAHIFIDIMTNYNGIVLTMITLYMPNFINTGSVKVEDHHSMLELYVDFQDYDASKEVQNVLPKYPDFPKDFIVQHIKERARRYEYVCASANYRMLILKLVSNFNGPDIGYFSSISVVIFRGEQYVHSETWNAWPCPSWNLGSPILPTLVIEGPTDDVKVIFRKNKLGESDNIGRDIDYATFTSTQTFSSPSLQITSLSSITSPLSQLTFIYAVQSEFLPGSCRIGSNEFVTNVRQTSTGSIQIQKYRPDWTQSSNIEMVKYNPFERANC